MKKTITRRIVTSYITVIIISLVVVGVLFSLLARSYVERQARDSLIKDANTIVDVIIKEAGSENDISNPKVKQSIREKIRRDFVHIESDYAIVGKDLKILYPRNEQGVKFKDDVLPIIKDKFVLGKNKKSANAKFQMDKMEYMAVILPMRADMPGGIRGWIVLYTSVGPVDRLTWGILFVLLISLLITGVIAAIFGVLLARSIARPIIKLKDMAEALSLRDFDSRVEINTKDELEELANTINKMAVDLKEYDIAQKKFLQNASHELKTPLMSIQGYAEGIKDGVFQDNNKALDVIVEESYRLKGIVEEVIFLSKLETMDGFYRFDYVGMNEIIEKSVEKVKSLAVKNNININLVTHKDVKLKVDRDKFTQALINVLGNCLRYATSDVNVMTFNDGRWFDIKISDNGQGFDKKEIRNVFERFFKGKKGNIGLGLAITKVIIEKHSGTIEANNASNGGAEFKIRLPIKN